MNKERRRRRRRSRRGGRRREKKKKKNVTSFGIVLLALGLAGPAYLALLLDLFLGRPLS
jgi:uncharacterized iron-regulated membrane protein